MSLIYFYLITVTYLKTSYMGNYGATEKQWALYCNY